MVMSHQAQLREVRRQDQATQAARTRGRRLALLEVLHEREVLLLLEDVEISPYPTYARAARKRVGGYATVCARAGGRDRLMAILSGGEAG